MLGLPEALSQKIGYSDHFQNCFVYRKSSNKPGGGDLSCKIYFWVGTFLKVGLI